MDPLSTKAYTLFRQEAQEQLGEISTLCAHSSVLAVEQAQQLRQLAHKIKGAASFFGLLDLAASASTLEALCKQFLPAAAPKLAEVQSVVGELTKFVGNMPEAKGQ